MTFANFNEFGTSSVSREMLFKLEIGTDIVSATDFKNIEVS